MDVGAGMGRDTPDPTALEFAILAEAPLSDMAVAMMAPTPLTALAPPAWLCRLGRLHRPAVGGPR